MAVDLPLIPARILNEHVYCPRLAYLEWVDHLFADNADTVEGRWAHRTVDRERGAVPAPGGGRSEGGDGPPRATSVTIGSETLGLIARIDVVETRGATAVPVEVKRGRPVAAETPLHEPERVQLCAQVLLLREHGYRVDHAEVYFAQTRQRVRIEIDAALEQRTRAAIDELRETARRATAPPPLVESPKCPRCSLVGLCLPDEVNMLRERAPGPPRRLIARDPAATPLYATTPGSRVTKRGERVVLREAGETVAERRLIDVSHIAVFGNVDVGSALLRECFDRGLPVLWLTTGGWLSGYAIGMPPGNVALRMRQHRAAAVGALDLARAFVAGKIRNQRTMLRRHGGPEARDTVDQLARLMRQAESTDGPEALLGIEGTAARLYFSRFGLMLREEFGFAFADRNRRPPRDPVNALLSFAYAMLAKDATIALLAAGLDPYVGLYHRPRFGRPSLALDLAEEFRPLIADSVVLTAVNNGEIDASGFVSRPGAVALTAAGRRRVLATYERRMQEHLRHPVFGYRASYRRILEIQARLLAASLTGDVPAYRPLTTR
ncbi:MAG TPA: CRISPR-associated endonuclease Cas1 [Capillimicrobium sp.]|nr:CRISPR-associated endonuclease Cas1 [Capillimicrobium sp.]